jgi:hypothetical protein
LQPARDPVRPVATTAVAATRHRAAMAQRCRCPGAAAFQGITKPGMEATNNVAEQAIRLVVIARHSTPGTRRATGRQGCARLGTGMATCARQGRSVFASWRGAVTAWFHGQEAPAWLPQENGGQPTRASASYGCKVPWSREARAESSWCCRTKHSPRRRLASMRELGGGGPARNQRPGVGPVRGARRGQCSERTNIIT